jgi:hypothetical protein
MHYNPGLERTPGAMTQLISAGRFAFHLAPSYDGDMIDGMVEQVRKLR